MSARKCSHVSVAVGLGPPIEKESHLKNIGPLQALSEPNPGNVGPIKNSHPPSPFSPSSLKIRIPLQEITNWDRQETEIKPRKFKIKNRKNTEPKIYKTTLSLVSTDFALL